jgi:predicted nuclease of predicted toxin-antitoxin system
LRFVSDQDVDADVAARLRQFGHDAWTASDAGLARAGDDDLAVYAHDRNAVLLSHDREFSRRRRAWTIGQHIYLRCPEWDAADLLAAALPELLPILERKPDVFIALTPTGYEVAL